VAHPNKPKVVIVGADFGGLEAAKALAKAPVDVVLIDRSNHFIFQPLLYQVATAGLSPADISMPIRSIVRGHKNLDVLMAEVQSVDPEAKLVRHSRGETPYDYLVLATGAKHSYFGRDEWAAHAPGLKTIEDAVHIRRRILLAFENAEMERDPDARKAWLTFVVVGGGPTGVELAGAIAELSRRTLVRDFNHIHSENARVVVVEAGPRLLAAFPERLAQRAQRDLQKLGVEILLNSKVVDLDAAGVDIEGKGRLPAKTVLWAAGVQAAGASQNLQTPTDRAGRIKVNPDLTVPGRDDVFVVGDGAHVPDRNGNPLPGVAQPAIQQGRYVAAVIRSRVARTPSITVTGPAAERCSPAGAKESTWDPSAASAVEGCSRDLTAPAEARGSPREQAQEAPPPFRYKDKGNMATIGRSSAVFHRGRIQFGGRIAWLGWLMLHIVYLIGFRNRLVVLVQWAWAYLTWERGARLITPVERAGKPPAG
jgi:NADH dehydrogenase